MPYGGPLLNSNEIATVGTWIGSLLEGDGSSSLVASDQSATVDDSTTADLNLSVVFQNLDVGTCTIDSTSGDLLSASCACADDRCALTYTTSVRISGSATVNYTVTDSTSNYTESATATLTVSGVAVSFVNDIVPLMTVSKNGKAICINCHGRGSTTRGSYQITDLTNSTAAVISWDRVMLRGATGRERVVPFNSAASWLCQKVTPVASRSAEGAALISASSAQMPKVGATPATQPDSTPATPDSGSYFSDAEAASFCRWIDQGAPNN